MKRTLASVLALCLAAACGHKPGPGPGPDETQVRVLAGKDPLSGAPVVFHAGDGRALSQAVTDAQGRASYALPDGGAVTAIIEVGASAPAMRTVFDVSAGDEVVFGRDYPLTPEPILTATLALPGSYPGAASYEVQTNCASGAVPDPDSSVELELDTGCLPMFDVLGVARDGNGDVIATSASVNIPAAQFEINVQLSAWNDTLQTVSIDLLNAPGGSLEAFARAYKLDQGSELSVESEQSALASPTSDVSFDVLVPPGVGTLTGYTTGIRFEDTVGSTYVIGQAAAGDASVTLDGLADLPPRTFAPAVDTADLARPVVNWSAESVFQSADATFVRLSWSNSSWQLVLPGAEATTVTVPALPDSLDAYRPQQAPTSTRVRVIDFNWISGFDGVERFEHAPIESASQANVSEAGS